MEPERNVGRAGYAERERRGQGEVTTLLTPPSLVHVLRSGWNGLVPLLHPSAGE
jgi:hypothetical protein